MSNLPFDVFEYIDNFFCLKDKSYNFRVLSKQHENFKIDKCKVHRYKNLCACEMHDNNDKVDAITTLNINCCFDNISTMHFITKKSLNYAKRYLGDFGNVSHYCCGGTGVMYLDIYRIHNRIGYSYKTGYSLMDLSPKMKIREQYMEFKKLHIFRGPTAKQAMYKYVQRKTFNKRKMKLKVIKNKYKRKMKLKHHHKRFNRQKRQLYGKPN